MSDPAPTPPPTPKRWAAAAGLVLLLCVCLPLGGVVALILAAGGTREKDAVVATLHRTGAAVVRQEALALLARGRAMELRESLPPGLASLEPLYVAVSPPDVVLVKISGMGDFAGLVITRSGEPDPGMGPGERVAEGIYWVQPR